MKILWVNPSFLDYRIPVYRQLNALSGDGFFLIYSDVRVPARVVSKINVAIGEHAIGMKNETILATREKGDFANTGIRLPYQKGLYKAISKVNADIIMGEGFFQWTPWALLAAKMKGKKFIIAYERTAHTERNCPKWRVFYRKMISKFVDGYSVNGQLTKEYLMQLGISEHKIFVGGMSADSEKLAASLNAATFEELKNLRSQLSIRNGLTYLYVGQIIERKGVINLLTAWKKHSQKYPSDTLIVAGTGPLFTQYSEEFSSYDSIKMIGSINYDSIYLYYGIADVFIMPTLEDNWSLVVPEAMACGLPIACSIYNGCFPELVHENINGKLFDPLKEDSIIDTLDYFHQADLQLMGKESIMIEKQYNTNSVAQNIYNSIESLYLLKKT